MTPPPQDPVSGELAQAWPELCAIDGDVRAEELPAIAEWLDVQPTALAGTYPQVYHPHGNSQSLGIFIADRMVAHAATRRVSLVTASGPAEAVLVGSVATAPHARRSGLASSLIDEIAQRGSKHGVDALLLWSDKWDFYEGLGFEGGGAQTEFVVRSLPETSTEGVRPATYRDLPRMVELHEQKPMRVERDAHEMALLLGANPMTTMVLERDGEVISYACYGKGLDFPGWWHEVGGSDEDATALVMGAMTLLDQEQATVMIPSYRQPMVRMFGNAAVSLNEGVGALRMGITGRGEADLFIDGLDSI